MIDRGKGPIKLLEGRGTVKGGAKWAKMATGTVSKPAGFDGDTQAKKKAE